MSIDFSNLIANYNIVRVLCVASEPLEHYLKENSYHWIELNVDEPEVYLFASEGDNVESISDYLEKYGNTDVYVSNKKKRKIALFLKENENHSTFVYH